MAKNMLMILFVLISIAGIAQANTKLPAQQNTSSIPTYSLWCIDNPHASFRRVRRERRWACQNGANCSALEQGGICQELENFRSRAAYAFNDYYQKNPKPSSCDFEGAAVLTVQDPSTPMCKFPSNSTGPFPLTSSVTRTAPPNLGSFLWGLGFTYLAYTSLR